MTKTIYIIHENARWCEPLVSALKKLNLKFVDWDLSEGGSVDLSSPPPDGIFYNRMSASSHTRDHRFSPEYAHAILEWLELYGRKVVNGPRALAHEISKVRQWRSLTAAGVLVPRTIAVTGTPETILEQAKKNFSENGLIIKPNRGGKGAAVRRFKDMESFESYIESPEYEQDKPIDGIHLLQEYIQPSDVQDPHIIRCEFVDGKFLYALKVRISGSFELCPSDHCNKIDNFKQDFEVLADWSNPITEKFEKFLRNAGIDVAGIEIVKGFDNKYYAYDVNTNTNYNAGAEKLALGGNLTNRCGMFEIAKYLGRLASEEKGKEDSLPSDSFTLSIPVSSYISDAWNYISTLKNALQ